MAHEGAALELCLRDEHAVERISVMSGQRRRGLGMLECDGKALKPAVVHSATERLRQVQPSQGALDGGFPC